MLSRRSALAVLQSPALAIGISQFLALTVPVPISVSLCLRVSLLLSIEIIRTVANPTQRGLVHTMLANLLADTNTPQRIKDILTRLCVTASRFTVAGDRRAAFTKAQDVIESFVAGSVKLFMCDNIGYRLPGHFEQFVLCAWEEIRQPALKRFGIDTASRHRRQLTEPLKSSVTATHEEMIAKRALARFNSLIAVVGSLPGPYAKPAWGVAEEREDGELEPGAAIVDLGVRVPVEGALGVGCDTEIITEPPAAEEDCEEEEDCENTENQRPRDGKYENQHGSVRMDMPLQADFAKNAVVQTILNRVMMGNRCGHFSDDSGGGEASTGAGDGVDGVDATTQRGDDNGHAGDGDAAAKADSVEFSPYGGIIIVDGKPHFQIELLKQKYPERYGSLIVFGGPFHLMKEVIHCITKLFQNIFLRYIVKR